MLMVQGYLNVGRHNLSEDEKATPMTINLTIGVIRPHQVLRLIQKLMLNRDTGQEYSPRLCVTRFVRKANTKGYHGHKRNI